MGWKRDFPSSFKLAIGTEFPMALPDELPFLARKPFDEMEIP